MINLLIRSLCVLLLLATGAGRHQDARADDEKWGSLSGRFAYFGDVPKPEKLDIIRDADVCGKHGLVDESLVINKDNRGIANIVVWLYSKKDVPVHPDLVDKSDPVTLDNLNCSFKPRVLRVRTGQVFRAVNSDPVPHNVACFAVRNEPFNLNISDDKPVERRFVKPELKPLKVDCSSHSWMKAYLVVSDHPYTAVTDRNGRFKIEKLPVGEWEFRFWHERLGYLPKLDGKTVRELKRGGTKFSVTETPIELGELALRGKLFEEE